MKKLILLLCGLIFTAWLPSAQAYLTPVLEQTLVDSEEPFNRRIYSYDFDVSDDGIVHLIYAKPIANTDRTQIVYTRKKIGTEWLPESGHMILEEFGHLPSISTALILDKATNRVHVSYIVEREFIEPRDNTTHNIGLVYQTIDNDVPGPKYNVSAGGFHSKMQLTSTGKAIFVRQYKIFADENNQLRPEPHANALMMYMPLTAAEGEEETIAWRRKILNLPASTDYRLANYIYDTKTNIHHILYGDKNADDLAKYTTSNPPKTSGVPFPAGAGHKLWYVYNVVTKEDGSPLEEDTTDQIAKPVGTAWGMSIVDNSGTLSENEFWTDLILDAKSVPHTATYHYATDARGIHQGSSNFIGSLDTKTGQWTMQKVAGKTTGITPHRAGMGAKLLIDKQGGFHGIWDNSPDSPIDVVNTPKFGVPAGGSTVYRYSPDGVHWDSRQIILQHSVEGFVKAKIFGTRLLVLVLGDSNDAKLTFAEFEMPTASSRMMEISTDKMFYSAGETINFHARLQGDSTVASDLYLIVSGPYDPNPSNGALIPVSNGNFGTYYFGNDFSWHATTSLATATPALAGFPLMNFYSNFSVTHAQTAFPFLHKARYLIQGYANTAGMPLIGLNNLVAPAQQYQIHIR